MLSVSFTLNIVINEFSIAEQNALFKYQVTSADVVADDGVLHLCQRGKAIAKYPCSSCMPSTSVLGGTDQQTEYMYSSIQR